MAAKPAKFNRLLSMKYNQRSQLTFDIEGLYGPKAELYEKLSKERRGKISIEDPACEHHLHWTELPDTVLVIKKYRDDDVTENFKKLCSWLVKEKIIESIIVEPSVLTDPLIMDDSDFQDVRAVFKSWKEGSVDCMHAALRHADFVICLGGDGTLLYTSSLFEKSIPPIMSISQGSLGFLTPFPFSHYEQDIHRVINGGVSLTLRHRLECKVIVKEMLDQYHGENCPIDEALYVQPIVSSKFTTTPLSVPTISNNKVMSTHLVMNEVVIDRGPSPYITNLEMFCNGKKITTVQADGIIIATPTGSTAYALAAGASVVHPSTPSMVICPICPHSLSFRPAVVPAGVELSIRVNSQARNSAWASFDGRDRTEIKQGQSVTITTASSPIPSINNTGHVTDWFDSLAHCLNWNVREVQKSH